MPILDAALAFALTMLVVATVVTQIVSLLRNTVKLRNSQLQLMLKKYFNKELQPVVKRELNRLQKEVTENVASNLEEAVKDFNLSNLFISEQLTTLTEVTTEELTEKLKRSALGETLLKGLGDKAKAIFDELGRRYEVVGQEFTETFRKYSRRWATVVALLLALVVNIDSIHIVDSYIRDESMRQGVIAQRDAFVEDYNALIASLEKENARDSVTKEELEEAFSNSRGQLDFLTRVGFPIGWTYFPHAGLKEGKSNDFERRNNLGGWLMWMLGILLTAVLAGLGAPFWFDTVTGISRVVQKVRARQKDARSPAA